MKRTAEQWALFLQAGYSASGLHAESLAALLRAMVAEREAHTTWADEDEGEFKRRAYDRYVQAQQARRRAEGEE